MAGIAAGDDPNVSILGEIGIAGVARGASLISLRVFSRFRGAACSGEGESPCALAYKSDIVAGLEHALALSQFYKIAAVNVSLAKGAFLSQGACDNANPTLRVAIDDLLDAGIPTVAASGNGGRDYRLGSPACISSAWSVGAATKGDVLWSSSNSASFLTLLAPGVDIASSVPPDILPYTWAHASGTSMAAPHVSGAIAQLREVAPWARPYRIRQVLQDTGAALAVPSGSVPRIRLASAAALLRTPECADGLDNDGDGAVDYPADPGCRRDSLRAIEGPECSDGRGNDGDGKTDYPGDPECGAAWDKHEESNPSFAEGTSGGCGMVGLELLLPLWLACGRGRRPGGGRAARGVRAPSRAGSRSAA